MIKEINEALLEEVVKFSWEQYCNRNTRSFPTVQNYNKMYDVFLKALHDKDDKVLVRYENEELVGVLRLLVEKDENYLQSGGGFFPKKDFDSVAAEFIDYLRANYSNYEMHFGYPRENEAAINFLKVINAELIESSLTMELKKDDFVRSSPCSQVIPLEKEHYDEYKAFHDKHYLDFYWTSERVFENLDIWKIYIIKEKEKIVGGIFIKVFKDTQAEIFGIAIDKEYEHQDLELKLLSESLYHIFTQGKQSILYFIEEDAVDELKAALKTGFKQVDNYNCYKLKL